MFEAQISHAHDLISRHDRWSGVGLDPEKVPPSVPVHAEESRAWYEGTEELIISAFGPSSRELDRWRQLRGRLPTMISDAIRDGHPSPLTGYISYYHAAIVLLEEFEAKLRKQPEEKKNSPTEPPPASWWQAMLAFLPRQRKLRVVVLLTAGVGLALFAVWSSLPPAKKEALINWLLRQ